MENSEERRFKFRNYSLECASFLLMVAWSLIGKYMEASRLLLFLTRSCVGITLTNQLMYQSCTTAFGYNETECMAMTAKNESGHSKVSTRACDKRQRIIKKEQTHRRAERIFEVVGKVCCSYGCSRRGDFEH